MSFQSAILNFLTCKIFPAYYCFYDLLSKETLLHSMYKILAACKSICGRKHRFSPFPAGSIELTFALIEKREGLPRKLYRLGFFEKLTELFLYVMFHFIVSDEA